MQQGDYSSISYYQYPQNPNPNNNPNLHHSSPLPPPTYASAPPFTTNYPPSDHSSYPSPYSPYSQNPNTVPTLSPTAPSYTPSPIPQSFNPPPPPTPPVPSQPSSFSQFEAHGPYQTPAQQQPSYYPPYDQHQNVANYSPSSSIPPSSDLNPIPNPSPIPQYSLMYSSQFSHLGSSVPPVYDNPYESNVKFDHSGGSYFDEPSGKYVGQYARVQSDMGSDLYGKRSDSGLSPYDSSGYGNDGYGDAVYAYQGNKVEPYGARGTAPKSSAWSGFDDFGRPIGYSSGKDPSPGSKKIVRAVPKADTQADIKGGVQKFRVKLLAESGSQTTMDVLCQIGLDGIRMLDPSTNRTLRIYPLDTVTRFEVTDSSIFTFWSKSFVDIEARRIRLQSNSYTANTILDTVTAATIQLKEMGGRSKPPDSSKMTEQTTEKKKGFADLMNLIKTVNEEKDHWVPDEAITKCTACATDFNAFVRKHHCRNCGDIFCDKCTHGRIALTTDENAPQVRVCDRCMGEVTHRLSNAKEAANRTSGLLSHEDLAKKLQEVMERNRKASSGSRSDGSGRRMKEVACPTCTVHLQVQVPTSGSETIECGVCQHPFLVSSH